jgi:DNA end-binding protein Ku
VKKQSQNDLPASGEAPLGETHTSRKVWGGLLTFGLISMPVAMFTAATEQRVSFNQLHKTCDGRIKQQLFCPACNQVVAKDDVSKGYEHQKNEYVTVEETDLEACAPKSAKVLELSAFVPAAQVDPIFFESSYYLTPDDGGRKAYALVSQAMRLSGLVGIARLAKNNREHICVLRPYRSGIILQTLYWNDEVRSMTFPALPESTEAETQMAQQLVEVLSCDWKPEDYKDSYRQSVMELIQSKLEGVARPAPALPDHKPTVIDITAALQQSLAAAKARKGVA